MSGTPAAIPILSTSTLTVTATGGAWVRSRQPLLAATVEGRQTFGAATDQDFGFGSDGYVNDRYAIFSTNTTTTNLYARLNNNLVSEQAVDLGARPAGAHRYRIAWTKAIT